MPRLRRLNPHVPQLSGPPLGIHQNLTAPADDDNNNSARLSPEFYLPDLDNRFSLVLKEKRVVL